MGKLIKCTGHDVLQNSKVHETPWADVWIEYTAKPKRKKQHFGPTLIGHWDLRGELLMARELVQEHPDEKEFQEDLDEYLEIERRLASGEKYFVSNRYDKGTPSIYTAAEVVNRREAEQMLQTFLDTLGLSNARFKWKRTDFTVGAMSFGKAA